MMPRLALVSAIALLLSGCIDQSRVNDTCTWSDNLSGPLDLTTAAGRRHLRTDAEIANELMVRYGDAHGLHRPDLQRPYRDRCTRALTDTLIARHGVTRAQIVAAERDRVWWADMLFVFLPMALLAVAATDYATRRICRTFDPDDRLIAGILVGVVALAIAGLALGATNFWAFNVESWRLHNGHLSNRAFLIPIVTHAWACASVALLLCVSSAVLRFRRASLGGSSRPSYAALRLDGTELQPDRRTHSTPATAARGRGHRG